VEGDRQVELSEIVICKSNLDGYRAKQFNVAVLLLMTLSKLTQTSSGAGCFHLIIRWTIHF
jgi:hypothetical protein